MERVFNAGEMDAIATDLERVFRSTDRAIRGSGRSTYAARDLLRLCPAVIPWWRKPLLADLVTSVLGPQAGLVRGLFFDKPPNQTWAVPWHKDLTIVIQPPNRLSNRYSPPRLKAGLCHCEPPVHVLEQMLTLRIHLDAATEDNGPLEIRPGTHRFGKVMAEAAPAAITVLAAPGDVLAMRPLVEHASRKSRADAKEHRRVLHLEFTASSDLPDGYCWHEFLPVSVDRREESEQGLRPMK